MAEKSSGSDLNLLQQHPEIPRVSTTPVYGVEDGCVDPLAVLKRASHEVLGAVVLGLGHERMIWGTLGLGLLRGLHLEAPQEVRVDGVPGLRLQPHEFTSEPLILSA
jgi:hypothetical protein